MDPYVPQRAGFGAPDPNRIGGTFLMVNLEVRQHHIAPIEADLEEYWHCATAPRADSNGLSDTTAPVDLEHAIESLSAPKQHCIAGDQRKLTDRSCGAPRATFAQSGVLIVAIRAVYIISCGDHLYWQHQQDTESDEWQSDPLGAERRASAQSDNHRG
jgi:hypothetical protein